MPQAKPGLGKLNSVAKIMNHWFQVSAITEDSTMLYVGKPDGK